MHRRDLENIFPLATLVVSHYQGIYGYKPTVRATCQNAGGRGGRGVVCDRLFAFKGHEVPNTPAGRFMVQKVESYAAAVINSSDTSIHWAGTETVFISKEPFVIYSVVALSFERYLTSSQARLVHLLVIFNKQDKLRFHRRICRLH